MESLQRPAICCMISNSMFALNGGVSALNERRNLGDIFV